jgi:uncharacterized protein (TIRG00374 family)
LKEKLLSALKYLLFIGMGVGLLYLAFRNQNMAKLMTDIRNAKLSWILLASVFGTLAHLSRAVRWKMLIDPLGYNPALKNTIYGVMIGYVVNYALPRVGEVTRCAIVNRTEKIPIDKLVGTVLTERIFDMFTFLLIVIGTFIYQYDILYGFFVNEMYPLMGLTPEKVNMFLLFAGFVAFGGLIFLLFIRKKIMHSVWYLKVANLLKGFMSGLKSITQLKSPGWFIFHTLFIWAMYFMMTFLCFFAIEATSDLGFDAGLTILVVGGLAVIIPAPGGLGSFHILIPLGLLLYGINKDDGLVFATIAHASQMLLIFLLGGISMIFFQLFIIASRKKKPGTNE